MIANTAWNLAQFRLPLIRALQAEGCEVVCAAPADGHEKRLEGVRFVPVKNLSRKGLSPWEHLRLYVELVRLFQTERPDTVVLFTIKPNLFGNWAARRCGVPAVSVVEGLGYVAHRVLWRKVALALYRLALRHPRQVVFLNTDDKKLFLRIGAVQEAQCRVLPGTGINLDHYAYAPAPPRKEVVLLMVGRLLTDKGIREFAEAAQKAAPGTVFRLLGDVDPGNPASIDRADVERWQAEGRLVWLGSTDDVRPFLADADAVVLPSYGEGLSRVLLEALAMGKPIITTDAPGGRAVVDDGVNGFLVPPADAQALVGAVDAFAALPAHVRSAMGRCSRLKAEALYDEANVLPQYVELIKTR
jgi:glycosyltransferase involved in cell wall biosynthesis